MNLVVLVGRLCRDPKEDYKALQGGGRVVNTSLAVERDYKKSDGTYPVDFINVRIYGGSADYIRDYAKKGNKIGVIGNLYDDKYKDKNGNDKRSTYVRATKVSIECSHNVVKGSNSSESSSEGNYMQEPNNVEYSQQELYPDLNYTDDDVPF